MRKYKILITDGRRLTPRYIEAESENHAKELWFKYMGLLGAVVVEEVKAEEEAGNG